MTPIVITRRDWGFIVVANVVALAMALVSAKYALGWVSASAAVIVSIGLLTWFSVRHPEPLFFRLLIFGLGVGFTELLNDAWLIDKAVLFYSPGGTYVLATPLYMPLTWALLFITNGTVAVALWQTRGPVIAAVVMFVLSGLYIPGFEALAAKANWWHYEHVKMLFGLAPDFVVLGEALLALPLPWMCVTLARRGWGVALGLGVVEGLFVWLTTAVAYWLVGAP